MLICIRSGDADIIAAIVVVVVVAVVVVPAQGLVKDTGNSALVVDDVVGLLAILDASYDTNDV